MSEQSSATTVLVTGVTGYVGGCLVPRLLETGYSRHLSSRQETGAALCESGVPVTEFRAAIILGSGSASFEMIRTLTERLPAMICPRWVSTRVQPIGIRNVLDFSSTIEALVRQAEQSAGAGSQ